MQRVHTRLRRIAGNVASLRATGVKYGELAVITSSRGKSLAEVIRLDADLVHLQVFAGCIGIGSHAEVRFLGRGMGVRFSPHMLGRVFNGSGQPMDGGPELMTDVIEVGGPPVNPARRIIPNQNDPYEHPDDRCL